MKPEICKDALRLAVDSFCLALPLYVFHLLHTYDWDHPITRGSSYLLLSLGILFAWSRFRSQLSKASKVGDLLLATIAFICLLVFVPETIKNSVNMDTPPQVDIGTTTQDAAKILLIDHANPYASKTLSVVGSDSRFYGYKYGPTMIAAYAFSAYFLEQGFKYSSLVFFIISLLLSLYLLLHDNPTNTSMIARLAVGLAIFLVPYRLWYELFTQGVNDLWSVLLILITFVSLQQRKNFFAGIALGLSLSSKFSPGLFFLLVLGRFLLNRHLALGLVLGLTPIIPFLIWDYRSILDNYFLFHGVKPPDSTSLMSLVPASWWWGFSLAQACAMLIALILSFMHRASVWRVIYAGSLLCCFVEMTYREIHGNHILWFVPLATIIFAMPRPALSARNALQTA